jgi:hypothetical protein
VAGVRVGDRVRVRLPRKGGAEEGIVTEVMPDGSFRWKNRCNYERKAKPDAVTREPEREAVLSSYMQEWVSEGEGDEVGLPPGTRRG